MKSVRYPPTRSKVLVSNSLKKMNALLYCSGPRSQTHSASQPTIGTAISSFLFTQFVLTSLSRRPLLSQAELQKSWQEEDARRWLVCWNSCTWQRECLCLSFLLLMGASGKSSLLYFPRNLNQTWKLRLGASGKSILVYFARNLNQAWKLRFFTALRKTKPQQTFLVRKDLRILQVLKPSSGIIIFGSWYLNLLISM